MAMILDRDLWIFFLIFGYDTGLMCTDVRYRPYLDTNLIRSELDQLECHLGIILNRMYRRMRDTQGAL